MRRSHAAIAILFGSIGSWAVVPRAVAAAVPGILSPAVSIPFPETSPWLAQATSSSLSTDQQEQVDELLRQGQTRVTARDYAGAIAIYQQAAAIDGQNPRLFSGIAYLYVQQGEYSEAIAAYQRAIALDGDNLPFRYGLALSQYKNGQIDEALATYESILAISPREINAHLGIGGIQIERSDYDDALTTYQNLARLAPGDAQVYEALGALYIQQEDYEEALTYLNQGLRANPNDGNNYPEATKNLREAVRVDPQSAEVQHLMGYVLYQQGDREAAFDYLVRAVRLDPDLVAAHALLGELMLEREQYLQAVLSYRQVVEARPEDPAAFYNLGLALWGQGFQAQALSNVELAAILYERQGNTEGVTRARELMALWGYEP